MKDGVWLIGYFPIAMSVLVATNQNHYNITNQRILYKKRPKPWVLIYTSWQMFLLDVLFVAFIMQQLV